MAISSLSTGSVQSVLKTVGFRSLKLITTPTDTPGETFLFEINGVQVFIKGANLVPIDSFTPLITNGKTFSPHLLPSIFSFLSSLRLLLPSYLPTKPCKTPGSLSHLISPSRCLLHLPLFLDRIERILDSAIEANMNMVRIWGGGGYAADYLYDYADRKGT